jgi:hypothetical protein
VVDDAVQSGVIDAARKAKVILSGDKNRCSPFPEALGKMTVTLRSAD